ncbi:MAG: threonine-phosphate decarboxylase [Hyphomicrobiales bacterium]|nr:MAG: threonine-phosphate decarboxylase [Hyphomicrobiales bacterium]
MIDHGGNLDEAIAHFGGERAGWLDLSTGINRVPYPLPPLPESAWRDLPTRSELARLTEAARAAYRTNAAIAPLAGAQAAIQMLPQLGAPGRAAVLSPTYNEHARALETAGWQVTEPASLAALVGADLAVVVNPNNPTGERHAPDALFDLAGKVGRLVVDESFCDVAPELSVAAHAGEGGLTVLRSFGKFYGLAGLRLGFVLAVQETIDALTARAGPWPVSGAAIATGIEALRDQAWADATRARLAGDAARLDALAECAGWRLVGGTTLFRLFETADAGKAQADFAAAHIWSRIFPWSKHWVRLGLPGTEAEWACVEEAFAAL